MRRRLRHNRQQIVKVVVGGALGVALLMGWPAVSLADEPKSGPTPTQGTEAVQPSGKVQERAVRMGGGSKLGFTCAGGECTCTGDTDCNNMFLSGKCKGTIFDAGCDTSKPTVTCWCSTTMTTQPSKLSTLSKTTVGGVYQRGVEDEPRTSRPSSHSTIREALTQKQPIVQDGVIGEPAASAGEKEKIPAAK